jgi:hypothetical protein
MCPRCSGRAICEDTENLFSSRYFDACALDGLTYMGLLKVGTPVASELHPVLMLLSRRV